MVESSPASSASTPIPRTHRGKASLVGFSGALMIFGLLFLIIWGAITWISGGQALGNSALSSAPLAATIVGLLGVPLALLGLAVARVRDRRNFEVARALPLPVAHLKDGDLVWLRGPLHVPEPLTAPEKSGVLQPLAWYAYEESEKIGRDKWRTVTRETKHATAFLRGRGDDGADIDVALPLADERAMLEYMPRKKHHASREKRDIRYLTADSEVSACGTVKIRSDGTPELVLADSRRVIVTPLDRGTWIDTAEAEEVVYGVGGTTMLFAGLVTAVAGIGAFAGLDLPLALVAGAVAGLVGVACAVVAGTLSRFGRHRERVEITWNDVRADTKRQLQLLTELADEAGTLTDLGDNEQQLLQRARDLIEEAKSSSSDGAGGTGDESETKPEDAAKSDRAAAALAARIALAERLARATSQLLQLENERLAEADAYSELSRTEAEIAWGRTLFNEVATEYNDLVSGFPRGAAARLMGFKPVALWSTDGGTKADAPAATAATATTE